ncbi:glycosyltransferase family A protein [Chryseobacterium sp. KACC 21268]|nr:glycosyltransferase family A protein [Chryseobacterium sp. KACC 21268]
MFSVVIPYYKKRQYIKRCIDSVLAQTYQNFEIIIVDDGSKDDLKYFLQESYSEKITLIQQSNQGVSASRNCGVMNSKYDYVAFLDADDFWQKDFLLYVNKLISIKNPDLINTGFTSNKSKLQRKNKKLIYRKISEKEYLLKSSYSAIIHSSSVIVKKELFKKTKGFDTSLRRGEDIDMWLRLVAQSNNFFKIKNILSYYDIEIVGQVTKEKSDFEFSFASKLENFAQSEDKYRLFAKRFMYSRLFEYNFSNPDKTSFFIDLLGLNIPFYSFYRIKSSYFSKMQNSKLRILVNKYLKFTVKFLK